MVFTDCPAQNRLNPRARRTNFRIGAQSQDISRKVVCRHSVLIEAFISIKSDESIAENEPDTGDLRVRLCAYHCILKR